MSDGVNAIHIGYGKDALGFRVTVLEEPYTGRRFLAYEVEDWWMRAQVISRLKAEGKPIPGENPDELAVA